MYSHYFINPCKRVLTLFILFILLSSKSSSSSTPPQNLCTDVITGAALFNELIINFDVTCMNKYCVCN